MESMSAAVEPSQNPRANCLEEQRCSQHGQHTLMHDRAGVGVCPAAMVSFVNPGLLGSLATFNRVFGTAIAKSKDRLASEEELSLGCARSQELHTRVSSFILRRTAELNARYLPPLSSYVVFCKLTPLQVEHEGSLILCGQDMSLLKNVLHCPACCFPPDCM